ncbi:MFS transporter [Rickettsiales bacterium]|nr:MFS transporter [Rickettsiales bacterium]
MFFIINWTKLFFRKEIIVIFLLGISSGIPLALLLTTLKALFIDKQVDLVTIGFSSIIISSYSLKFLWSPLVDSIKIPFLYQKFGQRRSWILTSQIILIILIIILGIFSSSSNISLIFAIGFAISFTSATQDIAIDSYRINSIQKEDQAIASSFYIYGYHIGMLISGALALIISEYFSWMIVYYFLAFSIIIGIFGVLLGLEKQSKISQDKQNFIDWFKNYVTLPLVEFFKYNKWYLIFPFIISFKLCDIFAGTLVLPFLKDIGFSYGQYAAIVKTYGLFATMIGILFGGILVKKTNLIISIWIALFAQIISNLGYYFQSIIGYDVNLLYIVIFVENFSSGIGTVIFVAYLSSLCNKAFSATQYALLTSLAALGRSLFSSSSGIFAQNYGWDNFFLISITTAIPSIFLLYLITKTHDFKRK